MLAFLGIPAQALVGGVTVLTGLNPYTVAAHFLVSIGLVAITTTMWLRSREPGVGQLVVRRPFALLARGIAATTALVLVIGTLVTGSGPHSGDADAGRTGWDPALISQLHADAVFLLLGLTVALLVALHATDSPGRVRRAARDLLVVELAQGVVGYVQYFTHLPIVAGAAAHGRRGADHRLRGPAAVVGPRAGVRAAGGRARGVRRWSCARTPPG